MRKYIIILVLLTLVACGKNDSGRTLARKGIDPGKPFSWGHQQTIYVFADDSIWEQIEYNLRNTLEQLVFTTENETYFEMKRADMDAIDQFYKYKNLIFFCSLDSYGSVSEYVKGKLKSELIDDVRTNSVGMFTRDNLWANDQLVSFLLADTMENLVKFNYLQRAKTFEVFKEKLYQRINNKIYGIDPLKNSTFNGLPWKLKVPFNYNEYKREDEKRFTSFLRRVKKDGLDKYVTVYHEPMDTNAVTKQWMLDTRKKVAWDVYDEDEFDIDDVRIEKSQLGNYPCWKIIGRWQNSKYYVGGSFQAFAFYDSKSKTAYLVDNSVYFPAGYKLSSLIELELISRTIQIK